MREIKFRIWHKKGKEWCGILHPNETISPYSLEYEQEDLVFCQFTGLKDSNGKEIYEGDILSITEYEDDSNREYSYIVEVRFGGREFPTAFVILNKRFSRGEDVLSCRIGPQRNMIVIGNILENPELLTKS